MKNLTLSLLALLLFQLSSQSQETFKRRKVVQIMSEQSFYLNGGFRASIGGKSRIVVPIQLPANTIEWYYVFTTTPGEAPSKESIQLTSQLTRILDPSGFTGIIASALMAPTGSNSCDIYLMDKVNADAFIRKVDLDGGVYSYYREGARENFRNGVVQVRNIRSGTFYLGFKNPSYNTGIGVTFEVAAIVEYPSSDNNDWSKYLRDNLYQKVFSANMGQYKDAELAGEITNCVVGKITASKKPVEIERMNEAEKNAFITPLYNECISQINKRTPEQEKGINYGNLGWRAYEAGDIDKCIEYSKKALELDSNMGWVKTNLAMCYMIKGNDTAATDLYMEAIIDFKNMKYTSQSKKYIQAAVDDLAGAATKYPVKGAETLLAYLRGELKNL